MLDCLILIEDNLEKYHNENKNPEGIQLILNALNSQNITYQLTNYKKIQTHTKKYTIENQEFTYPKAIISLIIPQPEDKHYKKIRIDFEKHSKHINPYKQCELVKNKTQTLQYLKNINNLQTPKTTLLNENTNIKETINTLKLPLILKPNKGEKGKEIQLIKTEEQLKNTIKKLPSNQYILQEAITESFGKDIRIVTAGNKIIYAIQRTNTKNFISNRNQGGTIKQIPIPEKLKEQSIKIIQKLKLNYASIDFLIKKDQYILCEVNSFPGLTLPIQTLKNKDYTIYNNLKTTLLKILDF